MQTDPTAAEVTAIYNAAWQVRHWHRPAQRERRAQAILALGFIVRRAFTGCEDFEPLLHALADALLDESGHGLSVAARRRPRASTTLARPAGF